MDELPLEIRLMVSLLLAAGIGLITKKYNRKDKDKHGRSDDDDVHWI